MVKHAGATRASIVIVDEDAEDGSVTIEITDDGRGFDPRESAAGFGLLGMRERLALVGGELEIDSTPDGGTRLAARIPIKRRPAAGPLRD